MARAHAANVCVQSDSIKGLAQSIAKPAYHRLLTAEPALRRAVPTLIIAFLITICLGAFVQVIDQTRQKRAALKRDLSAISDMLAERLDRLASVRQDRAATFERLQLLLPTKHVCFVESTDTDEAPAHNPATRFNSSSRLAERIKRAPARAKRFARASPIPLEAPVIQTTFLWNRDCDMLPTVLQQFTRAPAGTVTMTIGAAFSYCRVVCDRPYSWKSLPED